MDYSREVQDESHRSLFAVRVVRPYASEEQFLREEAFALTSASIVLVGAGPRPDGVILRFEVALEGGAILLRGEGRVAGHVPTPLGEPGLLLRFTRLDPRSKALVDRATARSSVAPNAPPVLVESLPPPPLVPATFSSAAASSAAAPAGAAPPPAPSSTPASVPPFPAPNAPESSEPPSTNDATDRERALERLRARLRGESVAARLAALGIGAPPRRG